MENNLCLYNTSITIRLDKKEKQIIKRNAYKNKITMSEYIRQLILIDNKRTNINNHIKKLKKNINDIYKAKIRIGRNDNEVI